MGTTHRFGAVAIGRLAEAVAAPAFERFGRGHHEIAAAWREIVGAELAGVSRPKALAWPRGAGGTARGASGAVLTVAVDGPRAIELQHIAPRVMERVNALYGYRVVTRLRLVQDPAGASARRQVREPIRPRGDASIEGIASPALGAALARLAAVAEAS